MRFIAICLAAALLMGCGNEEASVETATDKETMAPDQTATLVGGDVDPTGCIRSAGYIWSVAKNRCIRIWEEGTAFTRYESGDDSRKNDPENVYVVLSDDKSQAEIFFGGTDRPVLLDQKPIFEGDISPVLYERDHENVKIQYRKDAYWILHDGQAIYSNYYSEEDGFNTKLK
jgi:hypothetical protein